MVLRAGRTRNSDTKRPTSKPLGGVRRTQLITTYGVGAVVAVGDQSYIVSGLDSWKVGDTPDLREFRLQTRLGVKGFHLPPSSDRPTGDGVKVRRFPDWCSCPGRIDPDGDGCMANLRPYREFAPPRNRNECGSCGGPLTPSRFVVACQNGHLDDFPYWRWVHAGKRVSETGGTHRLSLHTTGRTASLRSIVVSCSCGKSASMEGAFGAKAMESIRHECSGRRPWLGRGAGEQGCTAQVRTLQRGSSAAWFPLVRSALSIPPFSQQLHVDIEPFLDFWKGEDDDVIARQAARKGLQAKGYSDADVIGAVRDYERYEAGERPEPGVFTGFEAADQLRVEEYKQLCHTAETPDFQCVPPIAEPTVTLPSGIASVMLVKRLREVRVLQSFTRVQAPVEGDGKDRLAALSVGTVDWLPGIEVSGEGVFLRFDDIALRKWETERLPRTRAEQIRGHHQTVLARRAEAAGRPVPTSPVTARFVLLHTLAHALINEWSLDAGYPAASLRERLYVNDDMAGILIYTASSDSAGSLGGLVAQGEPASLARSVAAALGRASWCSADPLCMESETSGSDSLNLAACYACLLLPETSCETSNCFLDRGLLIGTPEDVEVGFFRVGPVELSR